jgi:hypothetical protein
MRTSTVLITGMIALALASVATARAHAQEHQHGAPGTKPMVVQIPSSITQEHQEIHLQLDRATRLPGRVGEAARELATLLAPHFQREEQIALPPLGLLRAAAEGKFEPSMLTLLPSADSLTREMPGMLAEHKRIAQATTRLREVARAAGNARAERLSEQLMLHARNEEEVLYPAALMIGNWLRAQSEQCKCHKQ